MLGWIKGWLCVENRRGVHGRRKPQEAPLGDRGMDGECHPWGAAGLLRNAVEETGDRLP